MIITQAQVTALVTAEEPRLLRGLAFDTTRKNVTAIKTDDDNRTVTVLLTWQADVSFANAQRRALDLFWSVTRAQLAREDRKITEIRVKKMEAANLV